MTSQAAKAEVFQALHVPGSPFVIPNTWDRGSARMLAGLGAKALATTSSGYAFTLGLPDGGHVSRDAMLAHCADIVASTDLPVSADLENCYGEAPDVVAETVRLAAEAGLAGCSVEDTALPGNRAYDFDLSVERVEAAVAAARALGFPFMLTARADGVLTGAYDPAEGAQAARCLRRGGSGCPIRASSPDGGSGKSRSVRQTGQRPGRRQVCASDADRVRGCWSRPDQCRRRAVAACLHCGARHGPGNVRAGRILCARHRDG